jgi:hypothetical protein
MRRRLTRFDQTHTANSVARSAQLICTVLSVPLIMKVSGVVGYSITALTGQHNLSGPPHFRKLHNSG